MCVFGLFVLRFLGVGVCFEKHGVWVWGLFWVSFGLGLGLVWFKFGFPPGRLLCELSGF